MATFIATDPIWAPPVHIGAKADLFMGIMLVVSYAVVFQVSTDIRIAIFARIRLFLRLIVRQIGI